MPRIAIVPGDGIGQDVTAEAVKVLRAVGATFGRALDLDTLPYGADHYLATGITISARRLSVPSATTTTRSSSARLAIRVCRISVMRGTSCSGSGSNWTSTVNHRPIRLLDDRLCPLKHRGPRDVDFTVFRENTEGLSPASAGDSRRAPRRDRDPGRDQHSKGVHRITEHAFEFARARRLTRVCTGRQEQRHSFACAVAARLQGDGGGVSGDQALSPLHRRARDVPGEGPVRSSR